LPRRQAMRLAKVCLSSFVCFHPEGSGFIESEPFDTI
jgi:hypothetical protein